METRNPTDGGRAEVQPPVQNRPREVRRAAGRRMIAGVFGAARNRGSQRFGPPCQGARTTLISRETRSGSARVWRSVFGAVSEICHGDKAMRSAIRVHQCAMGSSTDAAGAFDKEAGGPLSTRSDPGRFASRPVPGAKRLGCS